MKAEILNTLKQLHPDGEVFSLFIKKKSSRWHEGGYFNDHSKAAQAIINSNGEAEAVYISLNPCHSAMLAKANNSLKPGEGKPADKDIVCYRNFYIDFDPVRPSGTCSSDCQHEDALRLAETLKDDLAQRGWPEPCIQGDTGNGASLIYRVADQLTKDETRGLFKKSLEALSNKYSNETVKIDVSVCDPSRLTRVLGTMNRKGDEVPEQGIRYRQSKIIRRSESPQSATLEQLKSLATVAPSTDTRGSASPTPQGKLNVKQYLEHYGIEIVKEKEHGNSSLYGLRHCVFDETHRDNESAIIQRQNGVLSYQCFHDSCRGRTWQEARQVISGDASLRDFIEGVTPRNELSELSQVRGGQLDNTDFKPFSVLKRGSDLGQLEISIEWAIDRLLPMQSITLLHGRGGIGKTWISLILADTINRGLPFMGLNTKKMQCVFVDFENSLPVLVDRIRKIGIEDVLFWHNANEELKPPKLDHREWEFYKTLPSDSLLIFDTLRASQGQDENDSQQMAFILSRLKELRDMGFTILLLHHTPKGNDRTYKGSTAILDLADHILSLHKVKKSNPEGGEVEDDDDQECLYRLGTKDKTRYEPFHIFMSFDKAKGFVAASDPDTGDMEAIRELLEEGVTLNQKAIFDLVKEELGIKSKGKVVNLLKKGEGKYWISQREGRAFYYQPLSTVQLSDPIYFKSDTSVELSKSSRTDAFSNTHQTLTRSQLSNCPGVSETDRTAEITEDDLL